MKWKEKRTTDILHDHCIAHTWCTKCRLFTPSGKINFILSLFQCAGLLYCAGMLTCTMMYVLSICSSDLSLRVTNKRISLDAKNTIEVSLLFTHNEFIPLSIRYFIRDFKQLYNQCFGSGLIHNKLFLHFPLII